MLREACCPPHREAVPIIKQAPLLTSAASVHQAEPAVREGCKPSGWWSACGPRCCRGGGGGRRQRELQCGGAARCVRILAHPQWACRRVGSEQRPWERVRGVGYAWETSKQPATGTGLMHRRSQCVIEAIAARTGRRIAGLAPSRHRRAAPRCAPPHCNDPCLNPRQSGGGSRWACCGCLHAVPSVCTFIQNALLQCSAVACRQQDGGGPANSRPLVFVPPFL